MEDAFARLHVYMNILSDMDKGANSWMRHGHGLGFMSAMGRYEGRYMGNRASGEGGNGE